MLKVWQRQLTLPQGVPLAKRVSTPSPPTTSVSTSLSWWPLRAKGHVARGHFYSRFVSICVVFLITGGWRVKERGAQRFREHPWWWWWCLRSCPDSRRNPQMQRVTESKTQRGERGHTSVILMVAFYGQQELGGRQTVHRYPESRHHTDAPIRALLWCELLQTASSQLTFIGRNKRFGPSEQNLA